LAPEADLLIGRVRSATVRPRPAASARPVRWAARAAPLAIRALGSTLRYRLGGLDGLRAAREHSSDGRVIYCLWHGSLLPLLYLVRGRGLRVLVSRHRDGEIAARAALHLGLRPVRGSTGRGGARALLEALRSAEPGDLAITPDGPRGPRGRFQPGAILLAARAGLPLVPVGCAASRGWRLRSWDEFLLPAPFARIHVVVGEPLRVPRDAGAELRERLRARAEDLLRVAEREARLAAREPAAGASDGQAAA
jgi:hypothetical protein